MTRSWARDFLRFPRPARRQIGGKAVEAKPTRWSETETTAVELSPPCFDPPVHCFQFGLIDVEARPSAQTQIHFLGVAVFGCKDLFAGYH